MSDFVLSGRYMMLFVDASQRSWNGFVMLHDDVKCQARIFSPFCSVLKRAARPGLLIQRTIY